MGGTNVLRERHVLWGEMGTRAGSELPVAVQRG